MKYKMLLLCMIVALLPACTGLKRGMVGESLVSTADPRVAISVPDLALRTSGNVIASVTTDDSLGGVPVETWLAVYGGTSPKEAMAIVALSEAPPFYYWDSDLSRNFSVDKIPVVYNGQDFQSCTYIVSGVHDAFASLVTTENPDSLKFIARRFAKRGSFSESKITMEYREALPDDISTVEDLTFYDREYLNAFEKRAYNVFRITTLDISPVTVHTGNIEGVRTRFLNTNFMGTLSRQDPLSIN